MDKHNKTEGFDDWIEQGRMPEILAELKRRDLANKGKQVLELYEPRQKRFYPGRKIEETLLTVVGNTSSERGPLVVCDCACGKRVGIPYRTMYYNQAYSCGCAQRPRKAYQPAMDFSGRTFGRLTVLEYKGADGWACLCRDCQQIEMVTSKPGYTYRARLEKAGSALCANREIINQGKPRWHVKLGFIESACEESYWVKAYGDTPEEAKANAMAQSDDPRNKIMEISRL